MKFRSIISISIIVIVQNVICDNKLTSDENNRRLENCGKTFLPKPSNDTSGVDIGFFRGGKIDAEWLLRTTEKDYKNENGKKLKDFVGIAAFAISPRHIFTSSQVAFNFDKTWRLNGTSSNMCDGSKDDRYFDIPIEYLSYLQTWSQEHGYHRFERARAFWVCTFKNFDKEFSPLLLELSKNAPRFPNDFPCLADKTIKLEERSDQEKIAHSYGIGSDASKNTMMFHRKVEIEDIIKDHWILTKAISTEKDRGGPLVQEINGKETVIGLKSTVPASTESTYFFNLAGLRDQICEFSGVCPAPVTTTTEPVPETTEAPTPPNTSLPYLSSIGQSITTTVVVPTNPPTTHHRSLDGETLDTPDQDSKDVSDEDVDNDFFVSEDFLIGGKGRALKFNQFFALISLVFLFLNKIVV